jgi:integrase
MMGVNRQHKNSVFSLLFGNPDALRELYGAIAGVTLDPSVKIEINTLSDVLFMDSINDLSFVIADRLVVLIEHQSTFNPNMPLRLLLYIARVYEKITGNDDKYSVKKIPLPRPEFIVLYNGPDERPDREDLKLTDAFADLAALGLSADAAPPLELVVPVYNINKGRNADILRRSETLDEYSGFIDKVREYKNDKTLDAKAAMTAAIKWCIRHGILKQFLEANASEVINMIFGEWNFEDCVRVRAQEAREEGIERGIERGVMNLFEFGMLPEQIAQALKLPQNKVLQYLGRQ